MKRYFVNKKAGSNKFWSIAIKNKTLIVFFGRINTAGRAIEKEFPTKASCISAYNKLIEEKKKKGYIETKEVPAGTIKPASKFSPLNKQTFWKLINVSLQHTTLDKQANFLQKELKSLSKKDLAIFYNIFNRLEDAAYSWKLWAAAYTIHAGCSDDSFADFRGWLITRGQAVYEKAIVSPDSLCKLDVKKLKQSKDGERFLFLASTVYEDLYDDDISNDKYTKSFKRKSTPSGREWEENNLQALAKINPALFNAFKPKWIKQFKSRNR